MSGLITWDEVRQALPEWGGNVVLAGYRGSESHGTSIREGDAATDDVDVFAITVQPPEWYLGLGGYSNASRQTKETAGDYLDLLVYDVRKFFSLLAKGNPNVHVALWLRPEDYLHLPEVGRRIVESRRAFLSTACLDALCGYAVAQFRKMQKGEYRGYMGAERKVLTQKFGYDVKHAAHCIRLLYLGIELVRDGTLYSYRPTKERELLKEVKRGEWSLEQVQKWVDALWKSYRSTEASAGLPDAPDYPAINALLVDVIHEAPAHRLSQGVLDLAGGGGE